MYFEILSSSELTEDQQFYVCGLLRLYRDLKFKRNIERVLAKPDTLYSIPIGSLSPSVSNENYAKMLSLLLQYSSMPYNDKITETETDLAQYIISPGE